MKVITIESSAYKAVTEQIEEIAGFVREVRNVKREKATDRFVGTDEAALMLGVCKRTLQRMRDERRIEYATVCGKCRYRLSEIRRRLKESTVKSTDKTLGELFQKAHLFLSTKQSPDFHKLGLCYYLKILYL